MYKIWAKNYRGVMPHDTDEYCKVQRKTDLLFQKWQKFGQFWPEHSKFLNFCFDWFLLCKVYNVSPKKVWGVIFYKTEERCKTWRNTCGLVNDMRNLADLKVWKG